MNKRIVLLMLFMIMMIFSTPTNAQIVTVSGAGASETAAINEAKRNAVEEVIGTLIKSHSISEKFKLIKDTIETRTQGYVNSCEIISQTQSDSGYQIIAKVDVSTEPGSSLMRDVEVVMSLQDPRIAIDIECQDDDENYKKYPAMTAAAIREELIKHGFTHVTDDERAADYIIKGRLTVSKNKDIVLPSWNNIGDNNATMVQTGLAQAIATLNCKIKKVDTDDVIGEFNTSKNTVNASSNDVQSPAVAKMAMESAQEVHKIFNREASKVFSSVRVIAHLNDSTQAIQLENIIRNMQGVNGLNTRGFSNGKSTIDVDTTMPPQQLYEILAAQNKLTIKMQSFSSNVLEINIY